MAASNSVASQEFIVVLIEQVDIPNRQAHIRDRTNAAFIVSWRQHPGGVLHVPLPGERYTCRKIGHTWYLDQRLDNSTEHLWMVANMAVGDTKLYADETLWIEADQVQINGRKIGPTVRDFFSTDISGAFTSVTLASTPVAIETVQPYLNGVLCEPSLYTLSGNVITFIPEMAGGHMVVYYQAINQYLDDDGTVIGRAVISGPDVYTP